MMDLGIDGDMGAPGADVEKLKDMIPDGYTRERDGGLVKRKRYLGDGVYVSIERAMIRLTVEDGTDSDPQEKVYLEVGPLRNLLSWFEDLTQGDREDLT